MLGGHQLPCGILGGLIVSALAVAEEPCVSFQRRLAPRPVRRLGCLVGYAFFVPRHRTIRSKCCLSNRTALAVVFKLLEAAQKIWRRLDGHNQLPKLVLGVTFNDGIAVIAKPTDRQPITAAA